MNRPGQPQQRPVSQQQPQYRPNPQPTAPPNQSANAPYPAYGMPPRNVLSAAGFLPQRVAMPSPFMQPRATNGASNGGGGANFPFALAHAGLPPHLQQQQQQAQQQQQQQHGLGSSGEAALDPNDFPALGAPPNPPGTSSNPNANNATGTPQSTSSYASAGSAPQPAPTHSHTHAPTSRDLTQDDFPALGENAPPTNTATNNGAGGPPGLFGTGGAGGIPGMLNLSGMNMMGRHPGPFDDKRHPNPPNPAPPNATSSQFTQTKASAPSTNPLPPQNQNPPNANANAPGNANAPNAPGTAATWPSAPNPNGAQTFGENGNGNGNGNSAGNNNSHPSSGALQHSAPLMHAHPHQLGPHPHPQTPAQQVLVSAADRWGLLGLLAMIREASDADFDAGGRRMGAGDPRGVRLSGVGTDLGTMGLDMGFSGNLYSTFITPWADQSAAHAVEPDFHLPACYASVHAPPPGPTKASAFSDETLFFMFYANARDALQEIAAQELWNRNWRYHKDLRLWITKESGTAPSAKVPGGEQGLYTIWDAESWGKEHKEMSVLYAELEEKNVPAFVNGPGIVPVGQQGAQAPPQPQQRGFGAGM
ncbi:NOT2 family protein [Mycena galericulata]|nr:NOT2 family protein [Mycena galericulata]